MSGGTDIYHEMIVDYSRNPINYGEIENHDVTFHDSNPLCGDSIDIDMKIDDDKKCSKEACLGNFSITSNNLCVSALFDCFRLLFFEYEIFRLLGVSFIGGGGHY